MLVTMFVGFFTVRIVLKALGSEDYGINNAVGGIVAMVSFMSNSLAGASQRFLSFYLGKEDLETFNKYFNLSIWAYIILSGLLLIICETVGLWFVHTQMLIPTDRMIAADWVYQCSIIIFIITIITTPYLSSLFSYEKMDVYAYVSILEAILKLVVAYVIINASVDRLKLYAVLLVISQMIISSFYILYTRRKLEACRLTLYWNTKEMKTILSFSYWSLLGAMSNAAKSQGVNVLLSMFFLPVVNAARGVAFYVYSLVNGLRVNFYNAAAPQITKRFASGEVKRMHELLFMSSKFAFFLVLFLAIPILINTDHLLGFWLGEYPLYSDFFAKLVVIDLVVAMFTNPLTCAISASGRIKYYEICYSIVTLMVLPISYVLLVLIPNPEIVFYVTIGISILSYAPTLYFAHSTIGLDVVVFICRVIMPCAIVFILNILVAWYFDMLLPMVGIWKVVCIFLISSMLLLMSIYSIGLSNAERLVIISLLKNNFNK